MCGLAFSFDPSNLEPESSKRMALALKRMYPRGPDAQEQWHENGATAGHVRLSIVDLAGSAQPMHSPDGRYTVVFNGEIYNYQGLRDELTKSWLFQTEGDTEVLL
ncbi:MAG: asparagine synthetase B, partial [Pseudomonadales bacterium]|nr:asparagine synthetase B [Pseudomonadales bacterium]